MIEVAGITVTAMRVSYVGEPGWELHAKSTDLTALYDALIEAGAPFGLVNFGSYALNSMRIEKGYHGWGSDIGTEYTLYDAGLEHFVSRDKTEFIGSDAFAKQAEHPSDWEFVALEVLSDGPDVLASDPVLYKDEVVGYVTSAAFGFRTNKQLALGYIKRGSFALNDECCIQSFGDRRVAVRHAPDVYDPDNTKLQG